MHPEREVLGDPQDLAGLDEALVEGRLCLQGMTPARGTLEIGELDNFYRGIGFAYQITPGRTSIARVGYFADVYRPWFLSGRDIPKRGDTD